MKKSICILTMLAALLTNPRAVSQSKLEATAAIDVLSNYRFRGLKFSEKEVVQPTLTLNYGAVTGTLFANHDRAMGHINEYDFILKYDHKIDDNVTVSSSFTYLDLPRTSLIKSREIALTLNAYVPWNPSITVAKDVDQGKGEYFGVCIGKDNLISIAGIPLNASATLGYNNHYWSNAKSWSHADASLRAPITIDNKLSVTPNITISRSLNKNYFEDRTVFGLNVAWKF